MSIRQLLFFLLCGLAPFTACRLIDEDLSDCKTDYQVEYELSLVTNFNLELEAELGLASEVEVADALRKSLKGVFTETAHDIDLSFYDVFGDSVRLHNEHHIMDANQSSYSLLIPVRKYMHVAVANIEDNHSVNLEAADRCHSSRLVQPVRDTVESHNTGLFSARLPMDIREGEDQNFEVNLYMANCASALVLDSLESHIKDIKVYASGFATGFSLADSTYRYADTPPVVRARRIPVEGPDAYLCFAAVTFPSKEVPSSKVIIETLDPFVSESAEYPIWNYIVYVTLWDGSVTETVLGVRLPLRAGQMKVIKVKILDDGSCVSANSLVGASVTLNWNEQPGRNVDL